MHHGNRAKRKEKKKLIDVSWRPSNAPPGKRIEDRAVLAICLTDKGLPSFAGNASFYEEWNLNTFELISISGTAGWLSPAPPAKDQTHVGAVHEV